MRMTKEQRKKERADCAGLQPSAFAFLEAQDVLKLLLDLDDCEAERDSLRAQLPAEMQDCTIRFLECAKGHGRLTATNWVDQGCPTCERDDLRAKLAIAVEALEGLKDPRCGPPDINGYLDDVLVRVKSP